MKSRNPETIIGTISVLAKKLRRLCDRSLSSIDLTGVQGRVLCYIFIATQWHDIYQKDIEETFDIRRSSATGVLQLLERNGMIYRISVPHDARLKKIMLTDKALQIQKVVIAESKRIDKLLKSNLSEKEAEVFLDMCCRIEEAIDKDKRSSLKKKKQPVEGSVFIK